MVTYTLDKRPILAILCLLLASHVSCSADPMLLSEATPLIQNKKANGLLRILGGEHADLTQEDIILLGKLKSLLLTDIQEETPAQNETEKPGNGTAEPEVKPDDKPQPEKGGTVHVKTTPPWWIWVGSIVLLVIFVWYNRLTITKPTSILTLKLDCLKENDLGVLHSEGQSTFEAFIVGKLESAFETNMKTLCKELPLADTIKNGEKKTFKQFKQASVTMSAGRTEEKGDIFKFKEDPDAKLGEEETDPPKAIQMTIAFTITEI